jgi:hypothetical protein
MGSAVVGLRPKANRPAHASPSLGTPPAIAFASSIALPPPAPITRSTFSRRGVSIPTRGVGEHGVRLDPAMEYRLHTDRREFVAEAG